MKINVMTTTSMCAMLVAASQPAFAQDSTTARDAPADAGAETGLADIIVTAQKRSESINRVPTTIVAVSGDTLVSRGITQAADLVKIVPGFNAVPSQTGTPVYYIRGVGFYNTALFAKPAVTLYADEAPLPFSLMALGATLDLERVEVLKGPQGTLFGSNSTGGAINFIAAKPTDTLKAGVDLSFGRFNDLIASGFVSGPLAAGIKARLAVSHEGASDWQYDYVGTLSGGSKNITSGRAIVDIEPSETLHLVATISGTTDRSDPQTPQFLGTVPPVIPTVAAFPAAPRNARAASFSAVLPGGRGVSGDSWQWQASLRGDLDLNEAVTLTSITAYVENRPSTYCDCDGTPFKLTDYHIIGKLRSFSQELRVAGELGTRGRWIVGGNYQNDRTSELNSVNINDTTVARSFVPLGLPPSDIVDSIAAGRSKLSSAFANVDFDPVERLTLHAGVRYTDSRQNFESCTLYSGNGSSVLGLYTVLRIPRSQAVPGQCSQVQFVNGVPVKAPDGKYVGKLNEHNTSWRLGADYRPVTGTMLYGNVSRGYKAGQYSNILGLFNNQKEPVVQEQVTAYEIGLKSDVIAGMLHVNAALFYYDYKNKQLQARKNVPIFGNQPALVTIPKSRAQGAEIEFTLLPARGLDLHGSATYVSTKVTGSSLQATSFGNVVDFIDRSFPNTPKWQLVGGVAYSTELNDTLRADIGVDATHLSSTYSDFVPDPRVYSPGRTIVDARIGVETRDGTWRAELWGRNILNDYYWTNQLAVQGVYYRFTGLPATYGASIRYRFQ